MKKLTMTYQLMAMTALTFFLAVIYIYIYIHTYIYVCVFVYVCMCVCVYVYCCVWLRQLTSQGYNHISRAVIPHVYRCLH